MKLSVLGKQLAIAAIATGLFAGCSSSGTKTVSNAASAMKAATVSPAAATAISDAKSAMSVAKDNNWIWRDTGKFLKQAEAAAEKGDEATAIKMANKAKDQAELAVQQHKFEQTMSR